MRIRLETYRMLLRMACAACITVLPTAAQTVTKTTADARRPELELGYTWIHSNAPAGSCGCFGLNGGNATFAYPLRQMALVGDISVTRNGAVNGNNDLTLSTFTVGARFEPELHMKRLRPYAQALVGLGHASGSLAAGNAFAANLGGGLNLGLSRHFGLRLFEADYLATTFSRGASDHQNNFRISTGVVVKF